MGYTLTLRKDAELDVGAHFEFYEEKREGLGHDFLLCLEEALDKVQRNPPNYRKIHRELRRIPIRRFPYRIFCLVQGHEVIVTAIFHAGWSLWSFGKLLRPLRPICGRARSGILLWMTMGFGSGIRGIEPAT